MSYRPFEKARKNLLRTKKNERDKFTRNCLRGAAESLTIEDAKLLGPIDMKVMKENAGGLFALVVDLVSKGHGLPEIEKMLNFKHKFLDNLMTNFPRLAAKVREARKLRLDAKLLSAMPHDAMSETD